MSDSREQFEAEFRKVHSSDPRSDRLLDVYNHGTEEEPLIDYYSLAARDAWQWWQASRAALVVELPPRQEPTSSGHYGEGYLVASASGSALDFDDTVDAIKAVGITVKGEG